MKNTLRILIVLITMAAVVQTMAVAKENGSESSSAGAETGGSMGGHDPGV